MRAGELRTRITLEEPSETIAGGNVTPTYTTRATVWAKMEGLGGRNIGITAEVDARFTIRYRTDVTARWRIGLSGMTRKFHLVSPPTDPDGRRRDLVMVAKEIL